MFFDFVYSFLSTFFSFTLLGVPVIVLVLWNKFMYLTDLQCSIFILFFLIFDFEILRILLSFFIVIFYLHSPGGRWNIFCTLYTWFARTILILFLDFWNFQNYFRFFYQLLSHFFNFNNGLTDITFFVYKKIEGSKFFKK